MSKPPLPRIAQSRLPYQRLDFSEWRLSLLSTRCRGEPCNRQGRHRYRRQELPHRHIPRSGTVASSTFSQMGTATPAPKRHSFITNFARAGFALNPPVDGSALVRRDQATTTLYVAGAEVVLNRAANTTTATRHYQGLGRTVATRSGAANSSVSWVFADVNNTASWQVRSTDSAVTWRRWTGLQWVWLTPDLWSRVGLLEGCRHACCIPSRVPC